MPNKRSLFRDMVKQPLVQFLCAVLQPDMGRAQSAAAQGFLARAIAAAGVGAAIISTITGDQFVSAAVL